MHVSNNSTKQALDDERSEVLQQLEAWLETPMLVLGLVWLALLVVELIWGLSPILETIGTVIWIIFLIDFAVKFTLAPHKLAYLKSDWLTAIALAVPALRVFRIMRVVRLLRVARAARGLRLVRVITSLNRGMKALSASMGRRGFGYVIALTTVVTLSGAAGMYAFENEIPGGLNSYGGGVVVDGDVNDFVRFRTLAADGGRTGVVFSPLALRFRCIRLCDSNSRHLLHRARRRRPGGGGGRHSVYQRTASRNWSVA